VEETLKRKCLVVQKSVGGNREEKEIGRPKIGRPFHDAV
jgi:hypothetical protein